jgi:hypothetical protein
MPIFILAGHNPVTALFLERSFPVRKMRETTYEKEKAPIACTLHQHLHMYNLVQYMEIRFPVTHPQVMDYAPRIFMKPSRYGYFNFIPQ